MRLNVFRNPFIDVQVSMILDNFDQAVRNQTEDYWRKTIAMEIRETCPDYVDYNLLCPDCERVVTTILKMEDKV